MSHNNRRELDEILNVEREILHELHPRLTHIKVAFSKGQHQMGTPVAGPVTLTSAGQSKVASVLGFDQFGKPWTGPLPAYTLSSSDTSGAVITFDPASGDVAAVANGTASITATLTTAEGASLTDTEVVTVAIPAPPPPPAPVLSSIKVAFA